MRLYNKILTGVLILSLLCFYFPKIGLAGQSRLIAKANTATPITKHKPEILSLPEADIPIEKRGEAVEGGWGRYVLAGVAVVGLIVIVAAVAGGGGGGGGGGDDDDDDEGAVAVSW